MKADSAQPDSARPLYGSFAWAYDRVVSEPGGPAADWVLEGFRRLGIHAGATIVDAGCGTGRYAAALVESGYEVIGVDRSEPLLDEARRSVPDVEFVAADLLGWSPSESVDGVLCRGVLNDLLADLERRAAFRAFAEWLRPGGALIADVRDAHESACRYASGRSIVRTVETDGRRLIFTSETQWDNEQHCLLIHERYEGTVDDRQVLDEFDFAMRAWTPDEIREAGLAAGFRPVEVGDGQVSGARNDRLIVTAVK